MKQRRRIYYSAAQRSEIWDRWQAGEPMNSIGRRFDRESSSVFSVISPTGGIRPPDRNRAKQALSLFEREEISRWLSMRRSLRSIALHLGRSASTISREVQRNGGSDRYRAARSDQAAWDRARRPKLCKLACRSFLPTANRDLRRSARKPQFLRRCGMKSAKASLRLPWSNPTNIGLSVEKLSDSIPFSKSESGSLQSTIGMS